MVVEKEVLEAEVVAAVVLVFDHSHQLYSDSLHLSNGFSASCLLFSRRIFSRVLMEI